MPSKRCREKENLGGQNILNESVLRRLAIGHWYLEVPLPPYISRSLRKALDYYTSLPAKDFVKVDGVCVLSSNFIVRGKVSIDSIKSGAVNFENKDLAVVEEKKKFTYEALGQILTYRYLFEDIWNATVRILAVVRGSDEELHPSEEAVLHTCHKLGKELGLVIRCLEISQEKQTYGTP